MATFGTLKTRVSKRVGLSTTATGNDDVLLGEYLNDAVRDFLIKTRVRVDRGEIEIDSETDDSNLSENVLGIVKLLVTGSDTHSVIPEQVDIDTILWYRQSSPSTGITARKYALQGDNLFMWYPSLAVGDVVTIYYIPKPTEMSASGNDPADDTYGGIPTQYHPVLEEYAAWRMHDYDDASQRVDQTESRYNRMLVEARRAIRGQAAESMGRIPRIGGYRTRVPVSESTDLGW